MFDINNNIWAIDFDKISNWFGIKDKDTSHVIRLVSWNNDLYYKNRQNHWYEWKQTTWQFVTDHTTTEKLDKAPECSTTSPRSGSCGILFSRMNLNNRNSWYYLSIQPHSNACHCELMYLMHQKR
jgi:hypothetical protein